jgi:hypothetical protein
MPVAPNSVPTGATSAPPSLASRRVPVGWLEIEDGNTAYALADSGQLANLDHIDVILRTVGEPR